MSDVGRVFEASKNPYEVIEYESGGYKYYLIRVPASNPPKC